MMGRSFLFSHLDFSDGSDIATFPWVRNLIGFYGAGELVEIASFPDAVRILAAFVECPAVKRGLNIPQRG